MPLVSVAVTVEVVFVTSPKRMMMPWPCAMPGEATVIETELTKDPVLEAFKVTVAARAGLICIPKMTSPRAINT